ncbi:hypothetical protein [Bradyrhizobium sp. SK17]|nr:hypothetical protein [Bradyrhizobium sp. SK17]
MPVGAAGPAEHEARGERGGCQQRGADPIGERLPQQQGGVVIFA